MVNKRNLPITTTQTFNISSKVLWASITDIDEMKQWYFNNIPNFKPIIGFETAFLVSSEERDFTHIWKVIEVIPNQKIVYTWNYKEYEGESQSIFEIIEHGNQCSLTISCIGLETFPHDIPEFTRESCQAGWNYFMNRLKAYLKN